MITFNAEKTRVTVKCDVEGCEASYTHESEELLPSALALRTCKLARDAGWVLPITTFTGDLCPSHVAVGGAR